MSAAPVGAKEQVARRLAPEPSTERVVVLVRKGAGHTLRRGADAVEEGVPGPDSESTWDRVVLERATMGVADEVLGYGADAYVEEPPQLRERVVRRLRETVHQDLDEDMAQGREESA